MRKLTLTLWAVVCLARPGETPEESPLREAQKALFAARYTVAAELYQEALQRDPSLSNAHYGLIRALIADHRSREAYAAAEKALAVSLQTAGTQTAVGLAAYRKGNLAQAEGYFRSALRLDAGYAGALKGLASVVGAVSQFKAERKLLLAAYRSSPGDPELMIARANTLKAAEHVSALREALAILDPESEAARNLRAHIANDIAVGDRKLRQLISPYEASRIKLFRILNGPSNSRGIGVRVQLNQRHTVSLILDTGASGVSVSPKAVERAGLDPLGDQAAEAKGIGDEHAQASFRYIASELRVGSVAFSNYPVSVFRSASSSNFDGLIGADVFQRFLVTIDFPRLELSLAPRPGAESISDSNEPVDAGALAAGFHRAVRFGNHLAIPTLVSGGDATLFLLDSGASTNLIDTAIGRQWTKVSKDEGAKVVGIQGGVKQVSRASHVELVFAGFRQENPDLVAISLDKASDSMGAALGGILGMPVLGQLRVTIDYREGAIRLEQPKQ